MTLGKFGRLSGRWVYGLLLLAVGAALSIGGAQLINLGGSFYYLPAGLAAALAGLAVLTGRWRKAAAIYALLMLVTLVWALFEAGLNGWALMPRLIAPAILGIPFLIVAMAGRARLDRFAALASLLIAVTLAVIVWNASKYTPAPADSAEIATSAPTEFESEWREFGNGQAGQHHSPLTQINRQNVGDLELAWRYKIGPAQTKPIGQQQTQPVMIGNRLYGCTADNDIFSLAPETGEQRWYYDTKLNGEGLYSVKCRGVVYHEITQSQSACAKRIYSATNDGRLIGLDAETGKPCPGFGDGGTVDLMAQMEARGPGYYRVTSAPLLIDGKLVIGGAIADGQHVGEPSGVVRAYDAETGDLAWAWDIDRPGESAAPAEGQNFSSGTPNAWGPMSGDSALGLVYVPTANATPDYWGGHRSPESNRYASSVVALDVKTGQPRWHFQTVRYDVWDYDVASQPVLVDLRAKSGPIPALVQNTKRGQIFVLDRRDGKPIFPVEERPAPQQGAVEKLPVTQPWSSEMPDMAGPPLTEARMWGVSALDQLWCRIKFREARYDGPLTPPGEDYAIVDPGYTGGVNWGAAAIDEARQIAFIQSNHMVNRFRLVPRSDPMAKGLKADPGSNLGGLVPQEGTPYAADIKPFMSPIGIPCQQPPFGRINAVDLTSGKLLWQRPLGSARDLGPMRMPSGLPFTIGTMTFGGTMSTAGGLIFTGGSMDHAFRAFDSESGELLFEADMPGNSGTRPMTFQSAKDGRQYVLIASDGVRTATESYGWINAYALPAK